MATCMFSDLRLVAMMEVVGLVGSIIRWGVISLLSFVSCVAFGW